MTTRRPQSAHLARAALALAAALAASLTLTTCGGGGGNPPPGPGPLSLITASLPEGIKTQLYGVSLKASGGKQPYTWSIVSGEPPDGLRLTSAGYLSGVPTESGLFDFSVQVRDSASQSASRALTLKVVEPLVITSSFEAVLNIPYSQTLAATGGSGSYTWTTSRDLPPGFTLSAGGVLSGTPTEAGHWVFDVHVNDAGPPAQTASHWFDIIVYKDLTIRTWSLSNGVVGHAYREAILAAGGTPPYTWRLGGGSLPPGLSIDAATGEVAGTPTQVTYSVFVVEVSDSSVPQQVKSSSVSLTIDPVVYVETAWLGDGVKDSPYYWVIYARGGRSPYALSIVSGSLPPGLSVQASSSDAENGYFRISGTPTAVGSYSFTVKVTDSSSPPDTATRDESIRINERLVITTTSLPSGMTGDPYSVTLTASGGIPPYAWGIYTWPGLPAGLALDGAAGTITGTPTEAFYGNLGLSVSDSSNPSQNTGVSLPFRIIGRLAITTSQLPAARPNVPYRVSLGLFGGTAPYTWSITSGALPSGLALNAASGQITGTPTVEGTSNFTVQVMDTGPPVQTTSRQFSLTITNSMGRNDSPATATPISNGRFRASISPYADPVSGPAYPDNDYYALTVNPGAVARVETMAERLTPQSPLDTVIEIVDSDGNRLSTCRPYTWYGFWLPCLSDDDLEASTLDSRLEFKASDSASGPVTIYVRVLSWDGSARPDYVYDLLVSGAN